MRMFAKMWAVATLVLLLSGTSPADKLVIVVNKGGALTEVSKADVKRIYLGRMKKSGTTKVVPINLPLESIFGQVNILAPLLLFGPSISCSVLLKVMCRNPTGLQQEVNSILNHILADSRGACDHEQHSACRG